jgi:hypothetical protein
MSNPEYLTLLEFTTGEIAYTYRYGKLSSDLRRCRIYQQKCENFISGTWMPVRKVRTRSCCKLKMSTTGVEMT